MGVVYKALDTKLDREVALKFLPNHLLGDAEVRKRFEREAKAAASLSHPNICTVHEIDEADGKTFIAMELVKGESLEAHIEKGPLQLKEALDIARQTADGLQEAHANGVVHRDVKPGNIIVAPDGRVKVLDFGLALLTEGSKLTQLETTVGTVAYMSPEQTQAAEVDHRTDIWALGCIVYEMVCGQRPFQGTYDQAVMYSILNEEPEPLTGLRSGVPVELEVYVGRALAKDPSERYDDARHFGSDLRTLAEKIKSGRSVVLKSTMSQVVAGQPKAAGPKASKREFLVWGLLALTGLALAILAAVHIGEAPVERQVRRFSFTTQSIMREWVPTRVAISPDGRNIAFVSGGDPATLWVRPIDQEQARQLEGTEGAQWGIFWSPDSRFVGFSASGQLKKVAIAGGPPITVCPLPGSIYDGGDWSPDGNTIVFSSSAGDPILYQAPARGGEPQLLFEPVRKEYGRGNQHPHFLPSEAGARALLLTVGNRTNREIYVKNLETGELTLLGEGVRPLYSSSGHVIYQTGAEKGGLWAPPFSLQTLKPTGEVFPIAEGVGDASLSVDGTLVALDIAGDARERLVWRDRAGTKVGEIGRPQAQILYPSLSPSSGRVAVSSRDDTASPRNIWLYDVERPVKQRLTFADAADHFPAWSPDGERVVFSSDRSAFRGLFERRMDGSEEAYKLVDSPGDQQLGEWSPDGRHLIYSVTREATAADIWILSKGVDGESADSRPFLETAFAEQSPQISPDGRYVAYRTDESGEDQVFVREFPEGNGRWQVSTNGGVQPRWSHDGTELFFVDGNALMAAKVTTTPSFAVGEVRGLFDDPYLGRSSWDYDVSEDGRFVMVEEIVPEGESRRKPSIHITQNWYEEFRDRKQD